MEVKRKVTHSKYITLVNIGAKKWPLFLFKNRKRSPEILRRKKMTGFQQRAWLSNDKKERKTVQWDEISIQLAFLYFQTKFYISQYMYWGL